MNRVIGTVLLSALQVGCSVFGVRSEEGPKYEVVLNEDNKEIRSYAPYIAATTRVEGAFKDSLNPAFRILAAYIFGENEKNQSISMTAPVVSAPKSEKIAMTAPVVQAPSGDGWEMSFMMPSKYKLEDLPRPKDSRVKLVQVPARTFAVIRFSGRWTEKKNRQHSEDLAAWLAKQSQYEAISLPMFAGYDPPWTIPWFRRNEMMIEVRKAAK